MVPVVSSIRKKADIVKMKFLVLALCVCAASAASFSSGAYKPWKPQQQVAKAEAQVVQAPVTAEYVPKSYVAKPYVPKTYAPKTVVPVVPVVPIAPVAPVIPKPVVPITPVQPIAKTAYVGKDEESGILRSDSEVGVDGFNYYYETTNGIAAQSTGSLKKVDNSDVIAVQGSYRYIAPDGTPVEFSYVADENGYQPQSDLLPVGPPMPEAIARSLEYIRTHPSKENY